MCRPKGAKYPSVGVLAGFRGYWPDLKITAAGFAIQCELPHRATDQDAGIRACISTRMKRALPVFQCLTLQQLF
jgi:hypothetical protein